MQQLQTAQRFRLQVPDLIQYLPAIPQSIEDTGLPYAMIQDLVLRRLFSSGMRTGLDLGYDLHLPYTGVIEAVLERLIRDKQVEFTGGQGFGRPYYDYVLTEKGRERARDAFERCSYVGPAPVPLADYTSMVRKQSREVPQTGRSELESAFHDMVMDPAFYERLGPAVNSVRSLFLYGAPGNGKTSIAERIATILRGEIFVPYALEVDSQIIQVFDPLVHRALEPVSARAEEAGEHSSRSRQAANHAIEIDDGDTVEVQLPTLNGFQLEENTAGNAGKVVELEPYDSRWVLAYRPRIVVGGELTLENLDLTYNPGSNFYESPYQVKATAGMLLIDDFGRQKVDPTDLLNRWIVPLEKKIDFLTLKTGKKFEVPFDLLIIFSTNLDPSRLVDEAFLRRIRYKIEVADPSEKVFRDIFRREADRQSVRYDARIVDFILDRYYRQTGRGLRSCHPRDILQLVSDHARFQRCEPAMTRKLVEQACESYFVHMEGDASAPTAAKAPSSGATSTPAARPGPAPASAPAPAPAPVSAPMDLNAFLKL